MLPNGLNWHNSSYMNFKKGRVLNKNIKSYQRSFEKYGVHPKALQWKSEKAAELRYRELVADLDFEGKAILDVGCGFGDIIPFILSKSKQFKYTGVDIVPEFIKVAKERYPGYQFLLRDFFGHPLSKTFDVIISSGTLNFKIPEALAYRQRAIRLMFDQAKEILAFNMAGGHPPPENKKSSRVYFVDSLKILEYCFSLTSKLIFRHHYHRKDFTIVMFK